ncbi:metal-dependent hydrolase family protein [Levilactobacillus acidifarinae]|uniref:Amidohydrolase n=1 Tax=Levilactobacillus acidifarinae DSM 19394 = JCM 15949 TaxID=1423715 RepID=A0A0R1LRT2_9LACO|nr:amidohydrolase family protein [Levilactobacillus acidifarinae]KRK94071.1 amidohydrolase [Levilactobacillus acidifarinae DSM 19394]GEO69762.1 amidohydrolase [Levilactobacillus acidifarinae]
MTKTFLHAQLFNGVDDQLQPDTYLTVDDHGVITALGTGAPAAETVAGETIDLRGKVVIPGLMNVHTHIMSGAADQPGDHLSETEVTYRALKNLKALLHDGVTYIRDCGCAFGVDIKLSRLQKAGELGGTEIDGSGRPISIIGGHGDEPQGLDGESNLGHLVNSATDVRRAVRENFKLGAGNIKVMATGGVMSADDEVDDTELTEEEIRVAVQEAHSKHMTVASHAQGNRGIQLSLEAGVDSIEHGIYIDADQIQLMKDQGTYLVPTLSPCDKIDRYGKEIVPDYVYRKNAGVKEIFYKNMRIALNSGINYAVGTDAGTPFNGFTTGTTDEIVLMTEMGLTPYQALLGATQNAAKLLQIDDRYGTLATGKVADFVVLDANPLADIHAVQQTDKQVYKKGILAD